jgi:hypothetical protein
MTDVIVQSLADAFMEVGVFVAVLVVAFGALQLRYGARLLDALERNRRFGPLLGGVLGMTPGRAPAAVGPVTTPHRRPWVPGTIPSNTPVAAPAPAPAPAPVPALAAVDVGGPTAPLPAGVTRTGRPGRAPGGAGVADDLTGGPGVVALTLPGLGAAPMAFWWLAAFGFVLAVPVAFQLLDPAALVTWPGGLDPYLVVGTAGTVAAVCVFVQSHGRFADDCEEAIRHRASSAPAMLAHGARETAFVTVWVAVAYLAYETVVAVAGLDVTVLVGAGIVGVLAGAGIGLIPGCAAQIVLVGLYAGGVLPLPALLANAVSQDGDALFPLLLLDRRAAVVTTVPAIAVGGGALLLGL